MEIIIINDKSPLPALGLKISFHCLINQARFSLNLTIIDAIIQARSANKR